MAKANDSNQGCFWFVAVVFLISVLMAIPAGAWIAIGVIVGIIVVVLVIAGIVDAVVKRQGANAAAAEVARTAQARKQEDARIARLGKKNAKRVDAAREAAQQVTDSEAAREGWLGDVDFRVDIAEISEGFEKATDLRGVADRLARLDHATDDDRRILADAKDTAARLTEAAGKRVDLIVKCAAEARLIDESLRAERAAARTAEQRAQLHGELNAMLYGAEAAPLSAPEDSAADRVMARVAAYRDLSRQIHLARDS